MLLVKFKLFTKFFFTRQIVRLCVFSDTPSTNARTDVAATDLADCASRPHVRDRVLDYQTSSTNNNNATPSNHDITRAVSIPSPVSTDSSPSSPPPPLKLKLSTIIGSSSENEADSLNSSYAANPVSEQNSLSNKLSAKEDHSAHSNGLSQKQPSPNRSRPTTRPPVPPPAVPVKPRNLASPTSSAPTDTCITGPMTPQVCSIPFYLGHIW